MHMRLSRVLRKLRSGQLASCVKINLADQAQALRTLFSQQMLAKGFLAGMAFYPTLAHTEAEVQKYAVAVDDVFGELAEAVKTDSILSQLKRPVAHSGFQRLLLIFDLTGKVPAATIYTAVTLWPNLAV